MGSQPQLWFLAAVCAALFLIFDTARYLHQHVSAVRLKQWSGADAGSEGGRWFKYDKQRFSIVSGILVANRYLLSDTTVES